MSSCRRQGAADQLARLGVDIIEAGFPISSPGDFEAVRAIAREVHGPVIAGLARANPADIDRCWEAVRDSTRLVGRPVFFSMAIILLAFVPLAALRRFDRTTRTAFIGLALFIAAVWFSYLFYNPFDVWWYLRFLLPALPVVLVWLWARSSSTWPGSVDPRHISPNGRSVVGRAWSAAALPVLHTSRGERHYTALFARTALALAGAVLDQWPKTFAISPAFRWVLPAIVSASPRSCSRGSRVARPTFDFTVPLISLARPFALFLVLGFTYGFRTRPVSWP